MARRDIRSFFPPPVEACCICYEPLRNAYDVQLSCGHMFHRPCILQWASTFKRGKPLTCPTCRGEFTIFGDYFYGPDGPPAPPRPPPPPPNYKRRTGKAFKSKGPLTEKTIRHLERLLRQGRI